MVRSKPCFEPQIWNVSQNVLHDNPRTTNRLEGWHNRWRILSNSNPGFYETVENLQREQNLTGGEVLSILQGVPVPKRSAKEVQKDNRLKELIQKYKTYSSTQDYLRGVALILKDF